MSSEPVATVAQPIAQPIAPAAPAAAPAAPSIADQALQGVRGAGFVAGPGFGSTPRSLGRGDPPAPPGLAFFYILAALFVPPVAVFIKTGDICETVINIAWWIFGWIPGVIHAFLVLGSDTRCSCMQEMALEPTPGQLVIRTATAPSEAPPAAPPAGSREAVSSAAANAADARILQAATKPPAAESTVVPTVPRGGDAGE